MPKMTPGDTRQFKEGKGKSMVLALGIWAKRQGNNIHIHLSGAEKFHVTVTNDPESERYHRTLFRNLRKVLIAHEKWPFGDEGKETEKKQ